MRHRVGAVLVRQLDQMLGDQRPGDRGAQQVQAFVDRVGAEHRKHEFPDEFLAHVDDVDVLGLDAQEQRLLARRFQLLALAEVGGEGHHLAAVFGLQPFQDDRGIEPAGIGQHDFLGRGHEKSPLGRTALSLQALPDGRNTSH